MKIWWRFCVCSCKLLIPTNVYFAVLCEELAVASGGLYFIIIRYINYKLWVHSTQCIGDCNNCTVLELCNIIKYLGITFDNIYHSNFILFLLLLTIIFSSCIQQLGMAMGIFFLDSLKPHMNVCIICCLYNLL